MIYYSKFTNGFYDTEIHGNNMPVDVVEISVELHQSLLQQQSQGKQIASDHRGYPITIDAPVVAVKPPPPALNNFYAVSEAVANTIDKPTNPNHGEILSYCEKANAWVASAASVPFSGSYKDLTDKPDLFSGSYKDLTDTPELFSNSYNDLLDKPTLFNGSYNDLTDKPELFSGSYKDLTDVPKSFSCSYDDLTNKPILFSGSYKDLTDVPESFSCSYKDLADKPDLFSGSYKDLADKPTLFSGSYKDLTDKPTLFSGSYKDLTDKPVVFYEDIKTQSNNTWEIVRQKRNLLLKESDWTDLPNTPLKNRQAWLYYRQALRDIPETYKTPQEVKWPIKP